MIFAVVFGEAFVDNSSSLTAVEFSFYSHTTKIVLVDVRGGFKSAALAERG